MPNLAKQITETSKKSFGMFAKAAAMGEAGADLIHLELGRPVHDTPEHIKEATIKALREGKVHYGDLQGEPRFREALSEKLRTFNDIAFSPGEVLVTNGLTQASFAAFMALIDEGDEVILLEPYYPQHVGKIELAGGKVVTVPLDAADKFRIRADWIEAAVTAKTKAIVLVNPCNPTGRIYGRDELEALARVAVAHDLFVISDEVYEYIAFDGHRHISIASLPGMRERTVSMFAFTKAYAMDGWRLGYIAADVALMPALLKITANEVTHVKHLHPIWRARGRDRRGRCRPGDGGGRLCQTRHHGSRAEPDAGRPLRFARGGDLRLSGHSRHRAHFAGSRRRDPRGSPRGGRGGELLRPGRRGTSARVLRLADPCADR